MVDVFFIKMLTLKNKILAGGREKKNREMFVASSRDVMRVMNQLRKESRYHVLLHSHYDPAWFARREITRRMLGAFYEKVIALLDDNEEYRFTADSQTQILEDILLNFTGKNRERIRKKLSRYIAEGRLVVGPYYAGIDLNLSSGAVLRRNILYGLSDARAYGWQGEQVGWMIDQFGFPAQMWQIHKKFGIESVILWRGIGLKPDEAKAEIFLESPDGSRMLAKWLFVQGYRFGLYIGKYTDIGLPRLIQESKKIKDYTISDNLLIMDGYEGEDTPDNPLEVIKRMRDAGGNILVSTPRLFMSELEKDVCGRELPVVRGYQNYGYYSPVLRGIISARQYVKQAHQLCNDMFVRFMDPLAVFSEYFHVSQHWDEMEQLWRKLIRMASHDELGGCGIDDIHRDSMSVYETIYSAANDLVERNLKLFGENINVDFSGDRIPVALFNTLPYERNDSIKLSISVPSGWKSLFLHDDDGVAYDIQILDVSWQKNDRKKVDLLLGFPGNKKLPAFGYKTFFIGENQGADEEKIREITCGTDWMENDRVRVEIDKNGTFSLFHKETEKIYRNQGYIRVEPDGGDTYDFSHIKNHRVLTSLAEDADIKLEYCGSIEVRFTVAYTLMVPSSLTEDRRSWVNETAPLKIVLSLILRKGNERLDMDVRVFNTVKDARIRLCFPVETDAEELYVNRQFDVHRMPFFSTDLSADEKEDIFKHMAGMISSGMDVVDTKTNINFKWLDIPVTKVAGTAGNGGIAFLNRDNFEFEIRNESGRDKIVEFTLLRSVGWNARADLLTRNINAGWEIYTPDAFCYGMYSFSFSVFPHSGSWKEGRVREESEKKDADIQSVTLEKKKGILPLTFSLFRVHTESIIISEITRNSNEPEEIICILYNPDDTAGRISFSFGSDLLSVFITNLDGRGRRDVVHGPGKNEFEVSLKKKEIGELHVRIRKSNLKIQGELLAERSRDFVAEKKGSCAMLEKKLGLARKPHVVVDEVLHEKKRWKECRKLYRKNLEKRKFSFFPDTLDGFIRKYREEEELINIENTVKEAHYSYLLTLKRYYETIGKTRLSRRVEKSIAKMGRLLIDLRVKKREAEIYRIFFENLKN